MKKLIPAVFLAVAIAATAAYAQDLPRIAVYVTGGGAENEKIALGTRMLASLVNSGRYTGIERSSSFLAEVDKEQEKQRSGAIDDNQISALGKQFGVDFVCIANITPVLGDFQVSARIVNVETAVVVFIGESFSPLETVNDLADVSDKVVMAMFGERTAAPTRVAQQQQKQKTSAQVVQGRAQAKMEREERERREKEQVETERRQIRSEQTEQAEQGRAEKKLAKESLSEQIVMKKVKYGANAGVGISVDGAGAVVFFDAGVAGVYAISKNIQLAPQVNVRGGIDGLNSIVGNFCGVSIPLLAQYSTDYRRKVAVFAEGGVGVDWLNNRSASVFNGELIVGGGIAFGRCVHIDIARLNLGTDYSSWNIMNVRVLF